MQSSSVQSTSSSSNVSTIASNISVEMRAMFARYDRDEIISAFREGLLGDALTFAKNLRENCTIAFAKNILNDSWVFDKRHPDEVIQAFKNGEYGNYQNFINKVLKASDGAFIEAILSHPQLDTSLPYCGQTLLRSSMAHCWQLGGIHNLPPNNPSAIAVRVLLKKHPTEAAKFTSRSASSSSSLSASSDVISEACYREFLRENYEKARQKIIEEEKKLAQSATASRSASSTSAPRSSSVLPPSLPKSSSSSTPAANHSILLSIELNDRTDLALLPKLSEYIITARINVGTTAAMISALPDHVEITHIATALMKSDLHHFINERAKRLLKVGRIHGLFPDNLFLHSFLMNPSDRENPWFNAMAPNLSEYQNESSSDSSNSAATNSKKRNATALLPNAASSLSLSSSSSSSDVKAQSNKKAKTVGLTNSFFRNVMVKANELSAVRGSYKTDLAQFEKELKSLVSMESSEHVKDPFTQERLTDPVHIGTGHVYNRKTLADVKTDKEGKKKCPMTAKVFTENDIIPLPKEIFVKSNKFYDQVVAQSQARLKLFQEKIAKLDEEINKLTQNDDKALSASSSRAALAISASK